MTLQGPCALQSWCLCMGMNICVLCCNDDLAVIAGVRGANGSSLTRANLGPGIMGPGRPPVPLEFGGPIPMRPMGRGFPRPIGGIVAPGRPSQNEINVSD